MKKSHKEIVEERKNDLEIGKEVWFIDRNLKIISKKIIAIISEEKETKYKLEINGYGVIKNDFYLTKHKAEVVLQNFLDDLKFKLGDLIIFKRKEFGSNNISIGRIHEIEYYGIGTGNPYTVKTDSDIIYNLTDVEEVLKINNEYIENFGKIKELVKEFDEKNKEIYNLGRKIHSEYYDLESELKKSFKKEYSWTNLKKVPLFKDRFNYVEEYYD